MKYDLVVVGGGLSGVCAAVAAARHGVKALIIEKSNCLGGTATNGLVVPFMPNKAKINGKTVSLNNGIFEEIHKSLEERCALLYESFLEEELKLILNHMAKESGVDVLFHASLSKVLKTDKMVDCVSVLTIEGEVKIEADYFIDATGDAQVAFLANLPFVLGREKDNLTQPMTLSFRVGGVDNERFFSGFNVLNQKYKEAREVGEIKNPRENILVFETPIKGVLHFNSTRVVKKNPTSAWELSEAEIESREQVYELFDFMKKNGQGLENSYILATGAHIGIRESRKIVGEYTLTEADCVGCKKFDDAIATCNYDIDIHNPEGTGTSHHYFKDGEYYEIPYRSLIPKNMDNLLVVGRCISCDHGAEASLRIMPVVSSIGEAGGYAIALAKSQNVSVSKIDTKKLKQMINKSI